MAACRGSSSADRTLAEESVGRRSLLPDKTRVRGSEVVWAYASLLRGQRGYATVGPDGHLSVGAAREALSPPGGDRRYGTIATATGALHPRDGQLRETGSRPDSKHH